MAMKLPGKVKIVEVGPRDGLQNEQTTIDAAIKIEELAGRARLVDSYVDTAAAVAVLRDRADEVADYFKDAA